MLYVRHLAIKLLCTPLFALAVLANWSSSVLSQSDNWTTYTSADNKFSAKFPGDVSVDHRDPKYGISVSTFTASYASCTFRIEDYSYPANYFPVRTDFVDWFIDDSQTVELKAFSATLVPETARSVSLAGLPGREFAGETARSALYERIYISDVAPNAFDEFVLKVLCPKGEDGRALASLFLNSFDLLRNVTPSSTVDRDGLWEGDYKALQLVEGDGNCRSGNLKMIVDGLSAKISGSPSKEPFSIPSLADDISSPNFTGVLDPLKKGVTATIEVPARRASFRGEFTSDSTFSGTYEDSPCMFSVSLRLEFKGRLEDVAPKDVPPELKDALPLARQIGDCMALTDPERMRCFEGIQKENPGFVIQNEK